MALQRREFIKNSIALSTGLILPWGMLHSVVSRESFDIVIYGASSAGIVAAIASAQKGRSVIIVEPSNHLGGLTAGGLGQTDIGVEGEGGAIGGISFDFYRKIRQHYENGNAWANQTWDEYMNRTNRLQQDSEGMFGFEPHVAENIYREMLEEAGVPVVMNDRIVLNHRGVEKREGKISAIVTEEGNVYRGEVFMDATYECDLMAMAGVSYHIGRESNAKYDETLNGVQAKRSHNHVFNVKVDPYIKPGQSHSGVLPGVDPTGPGEDGSEDHRVQAYCYRMSLTDDTNKMIPIEKPADYEEIRHELLFRKFEAGYEGRIPWINSPMPNRTTDINNRQAVSTNNIGMNYEYSDGNHTIRERILEDHKIYQQGHMWAMANHPRVPEHFREEYKKWGLNANEYTESGNWTPQLYIREARRMIGEYVTTEHDCRRIHVAEDSIGLGSYNMDSHNVQRYITEEGYVQNEGNLEISPGGPYAISYRSLTPRRSECTNLLVCGNGVSSSHIAFGSIRMEPVFMILGQSSAAAADIALEQNGVVQDVPYQKLRRQLLKEGQRLDVDLEEFPVHQPRESI
ncbi:MAG: FAD-dependent oxidoreductase [Balneolales bacterium]